jgi:hypothetical protein
MNNLESNIKKYFDIEDEIVCNLQQNKLLRGKKELLHKEITQYISIQNLDNKKIVIDDDISFITTTTKTTSPLTFKYVNSSLKTIIGDEDKVDIIINFLKTHRNTTENTTIKRL